MPEQKVMQVDLIIKQIQDKLRDGSLKPGEKIPSERILAEQCNTTRGYIRKALQKLEHYGVLEIIPQKGIYIPLIKPVTLDALINNMKNELEILTKNLATASSDEETKEPKESFEEKIKSICAKYNLSDREADILQHIVYGYKNTEIADKLFISVNTVKYHIKNLYEKLEVQKRTEISSKIIFDK